MFNSSKFVVGQVVDMKDVITITNPAITPFSTLLLSKTVPAQGATISWVEETIADSAVTLAEGGDAPAHVDDSTELVENYCELIAATATVTNTAQHSTAIGISDLLAREVMKKTMAIKNRLEDKLINGTKSYSANTYTMDGILNLIHVDNRISGTTLDKVAFEDMIGALYDANTNYNMVVFLPANMKKTINGFDSVEFFARDKELGFDAELYHTVYGTVRFVLSEKLQNKMFVVNTDFLELATLIPFSGTPQPVSGSKQSVYLETQVGLKLLNRKAGASFTITA